MTEQEFLTAKAMAKPQLALLSVARWLASYSKNSAIARDRMFYELMLDYARRCIKGAGFEPEQEQQALWEQANKLEAQIREQVSEADAEGYKLYWVSWYSRFDEFEDGDDIPPFQFWITGQELGSTVRGEPIFTMCALLRAQDAAQIESVLRIYFPDRQIRFCNATTGDMVLSDRFVGFENRTAISW